MPAVQVVQLDNSATWTILQFGSSTILRRCNLAAFWHPTRTQPLNTAQPFNTALKRNRARGKQLPPPCFCLGGIRRGHTTTAPSVLPLHATQAPNTAQAFSTAVCDLGSCNGVFFGLLPRAAFWHATQHRNDSKYYCYYYGD